MSQEFSGIDGANVMVHHTGGGIGLRVSGAHGPVVYISLSPAIALGLADELERIAAPLTPADVLQPMTQGEANRAWAELLPPVVGLAETNPVYLPVLERIVDVLEQIGGSVNTIAQRCRARNL